MRVSWNHAPREPLHVWGAWRLAQKPQGVVLWLNAVDDHFTTGFRVCIQEVV